MIDQNVSLDLMEFVEQNVLPRYAHFDKAHNLSHANKVIRDSVALAKAFGADVNMAYAIAAYHDLGDRISLGFQEYGIDIGCRVLQVCCLALKVLYHGDLMALSGDPGVQAHVL